MLAGLCYRKLAVSQIPGRQKSANGSVQQGTLEHHDPAITSGTCAPVRVTFRSDALASSPSHVDGLVSSLSSFSAMRLQARSFIRTHRNLCRRRCSPLPVVMHRC